MAQHNISINDSTESDYDYYFFPDEKHIYAELVFIRVLSVVQIPVMILTLIALCFLVKTRPAAAVFVGHLILSDLIQVICLLLKKTKRSWKLSGAYYYSLIASLYFMACVSFERYLLVSHPIWYKSHQSLKLSCLISVIIWCVPLIFAEIYPPHIGFDSIPWSIACLIPYVIIILCFLGTWRGLSRSISLTALKRKLILGSLFLVLLTYTFLILPNVIVELIYYVFNYNSFVVIKFYYYVHVILLVNPLADCILYLLMRPDVGDMMKTVCCCRHQRLTHNQNEHSVVNPQNSCSTVVYISARKHESNSLNTCSSV